MNAGDSTAAADYLALSVEELLERVASADPAPGGGFVAAMTVALAAGLVAMAARQSRSWPEGRGAGAQAESLRTRVTELAKRNAEAYAEALGALAAVRKPAEGTGSEARLEEALARSAETPLAIGAVAADVGALAAEVAHKGEPSLRADVAIGAALCVAGARAAATLVEVNLVTTAGDERLELARGHVAGASAALDRALTAVV